MCIPVHWPGKKGLFGSFLNSTSKTKPRNSKLHVPGRNVAADNFGNLPTCNTSVLIPWVTVFVNLFLCYFVFVVLICIHYKGEIGVPSTPNTVTPGSLFFLEAVMPASKGLWKLFTILYPAPPQLLERPDIHSVWISIRCWTNEEMHISTTGFLPFKWQWSKRPLSIYVWICLLRTLASCVIKPKSYQGS